MGMDSLLMTQVSAELGSQFGEQIKFRMMLEDVNTLDRVCDYFDERLPAEVCAPVAVPAPQPTATATAAPAAGGSPAADLAALAATGDSTAIERLVQQQLQVMQHQMARTYESSSVSSFIAFGNKI